MASCHITGNKTLLSNVKSVAPISIQVADGADITVTQKGTTSFRVASADGMKVVNVVVEDVYYHERFTANLLSQGVLRQLGWEFHSTIKETFVITKGKTKVMLSMRGRVSILETYNRESVYVALNPNVYKSVDDLVMLHERLNHMGFDRMIGAVRSKKSDGLGELDADANTIAAAREKIMACEACAKGKLTRTPFGHAGLDTGSASFEVIHMDTFEVTGFVDASEVKVKQYGVTMVDAYSGARWFIKVDTKDEIPVNMIILLKQIHTATGVKMKKLYFDGGTEFNNSTVESYCAANGSEYHAPPPKTPQLNGIAERSVRTLKDGVRTMVHHAGLPFARFWSQATAHYIYVWNRVSVSDKTGVTPFELINKKKASIKHIGVFGSDVWCHIDKKERRTYDSKADAGVYLGHDRIHNCAMVYILRTENVIVSRDLRYRNTFDHARALSAGSAAIQKQIEQSWSDLRSSSDLAPVFELPDGSVVQGGTESTDPPGGLMSSANTDASSTQRSVQFDSHEEQTEPLEFEVEKLLDKKGRGVNAKYLVKWKGYDQDENTWEPVSSLVNATEAIAEYENQRLAEAGIINMVFAVVGDESATNSVLVTNQSRENRQ
jgi:hypothetical protein